MNKFLFISASLLISLMIVGQASAVPNCVASKYLNNCSGTDTGQSCYYKYWLSATNTCSPRTALIDDCIYYWDSSVVKTEETKKCRVCKPGLYARTDEAETVATKKYQCKTGDDGVGNCDYPGRYVAADGTIIRYCAGCMENYVGQNFSAIVGFATSCTQTLAKTCPITNCKNCGQKSWGVDSCFVPKNGFVNSSDQLTTIATTLDKCWVYDTAGNCMMCWWPYWFSGSICAKSSLLKAVTGLVSFLALSYLM